MRLPAFASALALLGVAACTTGSGNYATMQNGVGFGDYQQYMRQRESARASSVPYSVPPESRSAPLLPPESMPGQAPTTLDSVPVRSVPARQAAPQPASPPAPAVTSRPLAAPMQAPTATQRPAPVAAAQPQFTAQPLAAPIQAAPASQPTAQTRPQASGSRSSGRPLQTASVGTARTVQAGASFGTTPTFDAGPSVRPGISDEQDFRAVSSRETIESDRARIERNRAQYQVIEVASVPGSNVSGGPNIIQYALSTQHAPGTRMHRRLNPLRWSRWENACLQYRNQDAAQEAFLARGGPERDPDHLDPDGDGYACWWDPTPVRSAMAHSN